MSDIVGTGGYMSLTSFELILLLTQVPVLGTRDTSTSAPCVARRCRVDTTRASFVLIHPHLRLAHSAYDPRLAACSPGT